MGEYLSTIGESLTLDVTVRALTPASYLHAIQAEIFPEGGPMRCYFDGRSPTSTAGVKVFEGGSVRLQSPSEIAAFRYVKSSDGVSGIIEAVYRK